MDEQALLLRALEERRFAPFGSDDEVSSDFQLIAGTNRDLHERVREGRFREDLLARLNLWTFRLPGLAERPEDLAPNLDFELGEYARKQGTRVTMSREVRERFLEFGRGAEARWTANFRDLSAAVTRMSTLAEGGRITEPVLEEELGRLRTLWAEPPPEGHEDPEVVLHDVLHDVLGPRRVEALDPFDRVQLAHVIRTCREAGTQSEAGRRLFAVSRLARKQANDADRFGKYLARFGLDWAGACGE